jgi:hypothetical protein
VFRRLFRLRLIPRDLFHKFDHLIELQDRTAHALTDVRRDLGVLLRDASDVGSQKELVRRLAALQDDLVRRAIADRRVTSDVARLGDDTTARLDALAAEVTRIGAAVDAMSALLDRQQATARDAPGLRTGPTPDTGSTATRPDSGTVSPR